jgi:hypothetical protein
VAPWVIMMRRAAVASLVLVVLSACTSLQRPTVQADPVALPTPLRSYDPGVQATLDRLEDAAALGGTRLVTAARAYRPSEPASLLQVPRAVVRADLADAEDGFVIIYDADDAGSASHYASELADYLGSGFGQANFAADTRFSVAIDGDNVVFTSMSPSRSTDPERAAEVFVALASVGDPVEVIK